MGPDIRARPWRTVVPQDGKLVTAWYRPGVGYVCGGNHALLAAEMLDSGMFEPDPDDEPGEAYVSTMMGQGWIRAGVIGLMPMESVFLAGYGLSLRTGAVAKIVRDLYALGVVRFDSRLDVTDEREDRHEHGLAREVL